MSTVSGARVRDELMDLLAEPEAPAAVERLRDLELDRALHPALDPDPELVASAALGAAAIGADRALAALAALVASAPDGARPLGREPAARGARPRRGRARGAGGARGWRRTCASASSMPSELRRPAQRASRPRRSRWRWRWARPPSPCCAG